MRVYQTCWMIRLFRLDRLRVDNKTRDVPGPTRSNEIPRAVRRIPTKFEILTKNVLACDGGNYCVRLLIVLLDTILFEMYFSMSLINLLLFVNLLFHSKLGMLSLGQYFKDRYLN